MPSSKPLREGGPLYGTGVGHEVRAAHDAVEELYRQHAGRLFNLVRRMIGDEAEAEDLLQEVFLLAFRKLPTFEGRAAVGTWLYRLAVNRCTDHLRSRASKNAQRTSSMEDAPPVSVAAPPTVSRLDLERAIAQLPDGCRAAFLLHDVEGFEHQEVARILEVSEGTSKSQVHKARMRLRRILQGAAAPRPVAAGAARTEA
jgi:RNA polymerase sigma-70 factor (ECF subfamily)